MVFKLKVKTLATLSVLNLSSLLDFIINILALILVKQEPTWN